MVGRARKCRRVVEHADTACSLTSGAGSDRGPPILRHGPVGPGLTGRWHRQRWTRSARLVATRPGLLMPRQSYRCCWCWARAGCNWSGRWVAQTETPPRHNSENTHHDRGTSEQGGVGGGQAQQGAPVIGRAADHEDRELDLRAGRGCGAVPGTGPLPYPGYCARRRALDDRAVGRLGDGVAPGGGSVTFATLSHCRVWYCPRCIHGFRGRHVGPQIEQQARSPFPGRPATTSSCSVRSARFLLVVSQVNMASATNRATTSGRSGRPRSSWGSWRSQMGP